MLSYYGRLSSEVYDIDKPIDHSFRDVVFCQDFGQVKSKHNSFPFT